MGRIFVDLELSSVRRIAVTHVQELEWEKELRVTLFHSTCSRVETGAVFARGSP